MKDDQYRLERISIVGHQLLDVVESRGLTESDLLGSLETQWLVTTPLFNIGEQANCLSREFGDAHPEMPISQIAGLRHRLVHDYEGTNWKIVAAVVFTELGNFIEQVDGVLSPPATAQSPKESIDEA